MKCWRVTLRHADTGDEYEGRFEALTEVDAVEQARAAAVADYQGTDTDEWDTVAGKVYSYEGTL